MDYPLLLCTLVLIPQVLVGLETDDSQVTRDDGHPVWGPWTEWTECGQTCGHGTQYRLRRCHSSGSSDNCVGPTKQLKICNVRDCPPWHEDYRSVECSKHDQIAYGGKTYRWIPYINEMSPCQLSCKSVGNGYYARFRKSVSDGITCNEENTAICIKGQCQISGCDGVLNSGAKPDKCGVCAGDGNTCQLYSGIFTRTYLSQREYNFITTIPVGARSVNISEMNQSKNYLALSTPSGYFLNGNLKLNPEGNVQGAGTTFTYQRGTGPRCKGSCLTAVGPILEPVRVEVLYFGRNPGILYSYIVPISQAGNSPLSHDRATDENIKTADVVARVRVRNSPVYVAAPFTRGERQQLNQRASKYSHAPRPLTRNNSSTSGGFIGQNRRRPSRNLSAIKSKFGVGIRIGKYRDDRIKPATDYPKLTRIDYTQASFIGKNSSHGYPDLKVPASHNYSRSTVNQTRPVQHGYRHYYHTNALDDLGDVPIKGQISRENALTRRGNVIPNQSTQGHPRPNYTSSQSSLDNNVPLPPLERQRGKERDRTPSLKGPEIYSWRISGFTDCTEPCGGGLQETRVVCVKADSQVEVMEENCDVILKPEYTTVVCNNQPCKARWIMQDWEPCSVTCGRGLQRREVTCEQRFSPTLTIPVPVSTCPSLRPQTRQYCQLDPCFVWKTSNWTKCSTVCGLGQRSRSIMCVDSKGKQVKTDLCGQDRPKAEEICDMGSCAHGWFHSKWSKQCSSECGRGHYVRKVYCSAPDGSPLHHDKCGTEIKKPRSKKACRSPKPCGGQWFTGTWSKCNSTCITDAYKERDVLCIKSHGKRVRGITKNHNCDERVKPEAFQICTNLPACKPQWFMMAWSECSKTCDTGVRTREVTCVDENFHPNPDCDRKRKPSRRQSCNTHSCQGKFAAFSDSTASQTQVLQKDGTVIDVPACEDKNGSKWCRLASQARLCPYYQTLCCKTCKTVV